MNILVIGAGSFGTVLATHLVRNGHVVSLWDRNSELLNSIEQTRINQRYLPNLPLPLELKIKLTLNNLSEFSLILLAVPSFAIREVCASLVQHNIKDETVVVSVAKGLDKSLQVMSDVIKEELPNNPVGVLSGPSYASEIYDQKPTAVTVASERLDTAQQIAKVFSSEYFRIYSSTDLVGVQIGGATKNVLAIAAGVIKGVDFGNNALAALITRGLAELKRLVIALGGKSDTVMGLSGLGDLCLTASSEKSRNFRVGMRLGRGEKLPDILNDIAQVAEGVENTANICLLAEQNQVQMPICQEVQKLLKGESTPQASAKTLMTRELKME